MWDQWEHWCWSTPLFPLFPPPHPHLLFFHFDFILLQMLSLDLSSYSACHNIHYKRLFFEYDINNPAKMLHFCFPQFFIQVQPVRPFTKFLWICKLAHQNHDIKKKRIKLKCTLLYNVKVKSKAGGSNQTKNLSWYGSSFLLNYLKKKKILMRRNGCHFNQYIFFHFQKWVYHLHPQLYVILIHLQGTHLTVINLSCSRRDGNLET